MKTKISKKKTWLIFESHTAACVRRFEVAADSEKEAFDKIKHGGGVLQKVEYFTGNIDCWTGDYNGKKHWEGEYNDKNKKKLQTIIDGVEYILTPVEKKIILDHLEIYPEDLGQHNWDDANKICAELGDGWRLPEKEELYMMWLNKDDSFKNANYWSSWGDHHLDYTAWGLNFKYGHRVNIEKKTTAYIRVVRGPIL